MDVNQLADVAEAIAEEDVHLSMTKRLNRQHPQLVCFHHRFDRAVHRLLPAELFHIL